MTREQLPHVASLRCPGNTLRLGNFLLPNLGLALHPVPRLAARRARLARHYTAPHSTAHLAALLPRCCWLPFLERCSWLSITPLHQHPPRSPRLVQQGAGDIESGAQDNRKGDRGLQGEKEPPGLWGRPGAI